MKLFFKLNSTALFLAVENGNVDIVKLLLTNDKIDVNIMNIFNITYLKNSISNYLTIFKIKSFNKIQN